MRFLVLLMVAIASAFALGAAGSCLSIVWASISEGVDVAVMTALALVPAAAGCLLWVFLMAVCASVLWGTEQ